MLRIFSHETPCSGTGAEVTNQEHIPKGELSNPLVNQLISEHKKERDSGTLINEGHPAVTRRDILFPVTHFSERGSISPGKLA